MVSEKVGPKLENADLSLRGRARKVVVTKDEIHHRPSTARATPTKHRIEDAVRNANAAVEEGIVAGSGLALLQARAGLFEGLGLDGDEAIAVKHREGRAGGAPQTDRDQRRHRG